MKDILIRALKTFVETALALLLAGLAGVNFAEEGWQSALIGLAVSAGAGALSAVWNGLTQGVTAAQSAGEATAAAEEAETAAEEAAQEETGETETAQEDAAEETSPDASEDDGGSA